MSSQKKDNKYFANGTVTQAGLLAYLQKEMSAEDILRCEKMLKDDPFASEALEGLQATSAKATVTLTSLNKKIRERAGIAEKAPLQLHWVSYAWAAGLLGVLIGVGVVMINFMGKQQEHMAQAQEPIPMQEQPNLTEQAMPQSTAAVSDSMVVSTNGAFNSLQVATDTAVLFSSRESAAEIPFPNSGNKPAEMKNEDRNTITVTGNANAAMANEQRLAPVAGIDADRKFMPDSFKSTMYKGSGNKNVEENNAYGFTTEMSKQKVVRGAVVETDDVEKVTLVTLDDAMKNFNSRNYVQAGRQFEAILIEQPGNSEALYYGGISDYINGDDRKSEKKFDRLLKDGNKYVDGSKWYKANLLLKKGKKEEALKILNELSESNSSYKERAAKKKTEVKF